tara:strand:+ start:195 stop:554 length:360 start_codon:yes stop_codon:yes gene_type:complete
VQKGVKPPPHIDLALKGLKVLKMKGIITLFLVLFAVGCSTIGAGIDVARNVASTAIDTTVQAGATVVGAVAEDVIETGTFIIDQGQDIVENAAEKIDEETDELAVEAPNFETGKLKNEG